MVHFGDVVVVDATEEPAADVVVPLTDADVVVTVILITDDVVLAVPLSTAAVVVVIVVVEAAVASARCECDLFDGESVIVRVSSSSKGADVERMKRSKIGPAGQV